MVNILSLFEHEKSRTFLGSISGCSCSGHKVGLKPSWYKPGDYSSPHTDFKGERFLSFIWNLSKEDNGRRIPPCHLQNFDFVSSDSNFHPFCHACGRLGWGQASYYWRMVQVGSRQQLFSLESSSLAVKLPGLCTI